VTLVTGDARRYSLGMSKTIIVAGYGPGISNSVAEKFGQEGFSVALVARNPERLAAGVKALAAKGIKAQAFPTDLGQVEDVRALAGKVKSALGPVTALHWNAYGAGAGDLTTASTEEIRGVYEVAVVGLLTLVQTALPDLEAQQGSILVTNGGLGFFDPQVDAAAVSWGVMGLAVANAAKHKAVALIAKKLEGRVYVGEVVVTGTVKGTAFDKGSATLDPNMIAGKFWELHAQRRDVSLTV
jgi:NADP-dependent 3-hydroxy acid dehydrogenase YdfG